MTGLVKLASVSLEGKTASFTPIPAAAGLEPTSALRSVTVRTAVACAAIVAVLGAAAMPFSELIV